MRWINTLLVVIRVLTVVLALVVLITNADWFVKLISATTALMILDTLISELKER